MAASSEVRSWRTAFLTLRDETLAPLPPSSLPKLLVSLVFSHSSSLVSASPHLPPHEVTSDMMLLVDLVFSIPEGEEEEIVNTFVSSCSLIHDVSSRVCLELNTSLNVHILDFLEKLVQVIFNKGNLKTHCLNNAAKVKARTEILEIIRNCSLSENTKLLKLLLKIVSHLHLESTFLYNTRGSQQFAENGTTAQKCSSLLEVQTNALVMTGNVFSKVGSSVTYDMWQSTLEVLRKLMDALASRNLLIEDCTMSRFYTSLLQCLHLVLSSPKSSLSEHVAALVVSLQMFFMYGRHGKPPAVCPNPSSKEVLSSPTMSSQLENCQKNEPRPYRPPHLRKREGKNLHSANGCDAPSIYVCGPSSGISSSDSEHSDSEGSVKSMDRFRCSKARIAAINCIQDLCQADPKSLSAHWTMLLPTSDVLQLRKYQATLMTCLLFDPILKVRMASASTLASMLGGPASVFLQVAEFKESTRRGSFTTLSCSLGHILIQLHSGLLYLIKHENQSGLLAPVFKVLSLLISATPYTRLPGELLPTVISTIHARISEDLSAKTDHCGLQAIALSCLEAALSNSPPSIHVIELLQDGTSSGEMASSKSSVLSILFEYSKPGVQPTISFEALQALRAALHNYPGVMTTCWDLISATVYELLQVDSVDYPTRASSRSWKGDYGNASGLIIEKCIMAAVKVLDECLRAVSGFEGTDDLLDERLLGTAFTSDCIRRKKVSSAPSYEFDGSEVSKSNPVSFSSGIRQWCEAVEKHLPLTLLHSSPLVRSASLTCFAGLTSPVFFSLTREKQDFILSSAINAALNDEVPSVRSAACRAIGVIVCFRQSFHRAEVLYKFIHATEFNTHDRLVSVRITASWALANICDSLRHRATDSNSDTASSGPHTNSNTLFLLADCALRLTKDGDKIKSNAVRALGNLSRFVSFTSQSTTLNDRANGNFDWLARMVHAFVSCVTTGNVKVQWNVCHALGNLFLNETLRLHDLVWACSVYSILLLLLRDSTNYKIRIHAAAALAVPASRLDYGSSFPDVLQGLVLILENLGSDQVVEPSSFKYRATLEKQVTATTLHILGLASSSDPQPLKDFLLKKATFLEEWLNSLCSPIAYVDSEQPTTEAPTDTSNEGFASSTEKKAMMSQAVKSLLHVYETSNNHSITRRFEKLASCL